MQKEPHKDNARLRSDSEEEKAKEEFVRLLLRHERQLYAYILSLVPSWNDADEVYQETNVRLWKEFERYEPGTNFVAWAIRVAHFQVMTWRKETTRSKLVYSPEIAELISEEYEREAPKLAARQQALGECIDRLSSRNRDLLSRCYAYGVKIKEVAEELNRTTASVYKTLQRVRLSLSKCIEERLGSEGIQ